MQNVRINEPDKFEEMGWFALNNLSSPPHSLITNELTDLLAQKLAEITN